jgi:hypothetical protein
MDADDSGDPLAQWQAEPLAAEVARAQLAALPPQSGGFAGQLRLLALRWWAQEPAEGLFETVRASSAYRPEQAALWALTWGQLHLACRLEGAWTHLDAGFRLASPLLVADDYFRVLQRHQRLRPLVLLPERQPGLTLAELLAVAQVTARLTGRPRRRYSSDPVDTTG